MNPPVKCSASSPVARYAVSAGRAVVLGLAMLTAQVSAADSAAAKPPDSQTPAEAARVSISALLNLSEVNAGKASPETLLRITTQVLDFLQKYPDHPRANGLGLYLSYYVELQLRGGATAADRAAWRQHLAAAFNEALAAPALSPAAWAAVSFAKINADLGFWEHEKIGDLSTIRAEIEVFWQKAPTARMMASLERRYLAALQSVDSAKAVAHLRKLLTTGNADVMTMAQGLLALNEAKEKPMELKFTAVDGRIVDLATLRGKVVLVDFWATWCGPCIAELPNLKDVYARYHDRGFEVVGVALDREGDRQKLLDFVHKEQMAWPQYYDGKWWKTAIAVQFGVSSIPAMFLLDQSGRIVTTNARGEKLEAEVKRLLKL